LIPPAWDHKAATIIPTDLTSSQARTARTPALTAGPIPASWSLLPPPNLPVPHRPILGDVPSAISIDVWASFLSPGGGNSSGSSKGCVQPATFHKIGLSLEATAAAFYNKTIGLSLGGSVGGGKIIGVSGAYSRQLVVSPNDQAALVDIFSVSPGAGGYGGFQYTNAKTPQDAAGPGLNFGAGAGSGLGIGGDLSLGNGTYRQIVSQLTVDSRRRRRRIGSRFITRSYSCDSDLRKIKKAIW
jgi:hypothetical protein